MTAAFAPGEETVFVLTQDARLTRLVSRVAATMKLPSAAYTVADDFLAQCHRQLCGCLVLHLELPGASAVELQQRLLQMQCRLPVLMVSHGADVSAMVRAMQAGAVTLLQMPFVNGELQAAIHGALELSRRQRVILERRHELASRFATLTPGEREVLALVMEGKLNKEIARVLDVGQRTVEARRQQIMQKLQADSVPHLVLLVAEAGQGGMQLLSYSLNACRSAACLHYPNL